MSKDAKADEHPYMWAVNGPPLGEWATEMGGVNNAMQTTLIFNSDGTGKEIHRSALSGTEELRLAWHFVEPGHLKIFVHEPGDGPDAINDTANWMTERYKADWVQGEFDKIPVLRHVEFDNFKGLPAPITLVRRAD